MWILRRIAEGSNDTEKPVYRLIVGEYLVGRKDCHIQVSNDQSVSRKHASITINHTGVSRTCPAQASVKDFSKFGTFINNIKCEGSVELKDGDNITFGTQAGSSFSLNYEPMVVFTSCLDNSTKKALKAEMNKLGGYMVNEWQKECTHLVMDALSFTMKVIYALVNCCPIVKPSYFRDLIDGISNKLELPLVEKYMPPIKEDLIDPQKVSFQPNEARKTLFAGKLFLFLEAKQHKRLHQAVTLAGGVSLLKEYGDIPGDDALLTDRGTLVISVDLKSAIPLERETWIGHVGDTLTSCHRRPIPETEVGLALLHLSLEEYCNSSIKHIPHITKYIVSKSLCTMEAMSQRANESQNVSVISIPEKKPISWKLDVDPSKKLAESVVSAKVTTPETRKRFRGSSNDTVPLVSDTPVNETTSLESKRRKLSTSIPNVTHVSQSPHSQTLATDLDGSLPARDYSSENQQSIKVVPKSEITHISQSEHSQMSEKVGDLSVKRRRKLHASKSEVTQSEDSEPGVVRASETPSPEFPFVMKRRKVAASKSDVTHISQSQRSFTEALSSHSPTKNTSNAERFLTTHSVSSPARSKRSLKTEDITEYSSAEGHTNSTTTLNSAKDDPKTRDSKVKVDAENFVKSENCTSSTEQFSKERGKDDSRISESILDEIPAADDPLNEDPRNALPRSGWISKKKSRDEKCEIHQRGDSNTAVHKDSNSEIEKSNEVTENSGRDVQKGHSEKLIALPGFISKQERRKEQKGVLVKQEDGEELPKDLLCIEHVELVVARSIPSKIRVAPKQMGNTKLKNMKRFRKQNYAGGASVGLPRIIGGSDLMVFSSRNKDVEDWFLEIQEINRERDLEDEAADKLFQFEPSRRKKNRR